MRTYVKHLFLMPALMALLSLIPAHRATAQILTTLHDFTAGFGPSSDGSYSLAGLIISSNTLYGTALYGGRSGNGMVFAVNTDGASFTNLYSFTASLSPNYTNSDGAVPFAGLVLSGTNLYGTAAVAGTADDGTVFAVNIDGSSFTNLHNFTALNNNTNADGANPEAGLVLSGRILYGTTYRGGNVGNGTVFAVNTDGTGFTNLYNFTALNNNTNADGANPKAGLVLSGETLYGTTYGGGSFGNGTVFAVNTDGTGFTNLHNFTALNNYTNTDGADPVAGLVLSSNTLYGTTFGGGSFGNGTVFAVNTDGTGFTNLHAFTITSVPYSKPSIGTNSDGAEPNAGLVLSGKTLYGTAHAGGPNSDGTVFAINTDGTDFTVLYRFSADQGINSDGAYPDAGLFLAGDTLYGTTYEGGSSGSGTVFSLSFLPQLALTRFVTNVVLTWPTNVAGFDYTDFTLQSSTNVVSPAAWSAVSPGPVIVNGLNTVTDAITGTWKFYRLSQ